MAEELEAGRALFFSGRPSPCSFGDKPSSRPFCDTRWDQDLVRSSCKSSHGGGTSTAATMEDSAMKSEIVLSTTMATVYADPTKTACPDYSGLEQTNPKFPCTHSSSPYALLGNLLDGDPSYMMNQDVSLGNLGFIHSTGLPENPLRFVDFPAMLISSEQPQFLHECTRRSINTKFNSQTHGEAAPPPNKNSGNEAPAKRPRIETPSPLPTFKVRKAKLGDRVTALQQLVSPFGKTDTASVLHEAIEYIKFLHAQVKALSAPYFRSEASSDQHHQSTHEVAEQALRARGLCLMPISVSYPAAAEATSGFRTPTFERSFR